ncbi:MAG: glycosyltransferase family 4 protein [Candidatus Colwellbacteria bacterium]
MNRTKVVFIINNFVLGGVERLLYGILSRLDRNAIDITIITVLGAEGPLRGKFEGLGVELKHVGSAHNPGSSILDKAGWVLGAPGHFLKLKKLLAQKEPDIVITSLYQADILGILSAKLAKVQRRIFIQHDVQPLTPIRHYLKGMLTVPHATKIVAVSETTASYLKKQWSIPKDKISVIQNGTILKPKTPHKREDLTLGFIGRLEKVKGVDVLIDALTILSKEYDLSPRVFVAGDGNLRKELKRDAPPNVEFVGQVDDPRQILEKIDILVVPSRLEGFGLTALEGLMDRKIVVASDIPALRELIKNGENGALFREGEVDELAKALKRILTDSQYREDLQDGVSRWVEANKDTYSIDATVAKYEKLIIGPDE